MALGDPRGIGAEVVRASLPPLLEEFPYVAVHLLGSREQESYFDDPAFGSRIRFESVGSFDGSLRSAGSVSVEALREGVELCMDGQAIGLVTAPVHKPALHAAGARFPGQTEFLQSLTGVDRVGMLMSADTSRFDVPIRILLATTHLPLRAVADALTGERIESQVALLADSLTRGWEIRSPRIALCALNPHASDEGLFGDEEERVMIPAVERLRSSGIDVTGPLPADTVFLKLVSREVDAVVVPYHDVGMAVFKTLTFGGGVNTTLGLPFLRTSPDHGTAFDLVGTGRANAASTLEALRLATRSGPGLNRTPAGGRAGNG